jgi:NTE family protein
MKPVCCALLLVAAGALATERPKIGLALGGGGARGCAHVGILRVLEELHVPIDYIAGTSAGAIVGGMYASGMTPDEIDRALTTTDWRDAFADRTRYKDLAYRRKEDDMRYPTVFEVGIHRGHLVLPGGLRSGQKLRFLLQWYLIPVSDIHDFSRLPVPFKAVAADIETGDAVVLDRGDLAEAIRASMAVPGVFSPMEIDGKVLVDGGIADNVPVDVVRAMGADIVIAVDVGSPLVKRDQLQSLLAVSGQVLTILTRQNVRRQIQGAEVVLTPPVSDYGTMDFEDARSIIDAGTTYGREQAARLAHLADATLNATRAPRDRIEPDIDALVIEGSRRVDDRIIRAKVETRPGTPLDREELSRDINRVYGLDDFQSVTFAINDVDGRRDLVLKTQDKPWGPTYVRLGIHLEDDLKGNSSYELILNANRTRLNRLGGEWRTDFRFGRNLGVVSEFYQPLDFHGHFFVAPSAQILRNTFSFFEDGRRVALFNLSQRGVALDLGMQFEDWGEFRAGVFRGHVSAGVGAGAIDIEGRSIDVGGVRSTLTITRTDSPTIPRQGSNLSVQFDRLERGFGATDPHTKLQAAGYTVYSFRSQSMFVGVSGGTNLGSTIPAYDEFPLGGLLNLGGFAAGQIRGQRFALARVGTYTRIRKLPAEVGSGLYAGIFGEVGDAWTDKRDLHRSITLMAAADTIIGPVFLAVARADRSNQRFYVAIGKTF